ncbi:MAG TPA: JAB domain-containing protein [Steroidobacter sp.]|uniref:JAB domain-containing protein n=1 Tax=Steroidobacter sp. TaxID=1978227 RepID=UPI002EDB8C5D
MRTNKNLAKRLSARPPSGSVMPRARTFTSEMYRKVNGRYRRIEDDRVISTALQLLAGKMACGPKLTGRRLVREYLSVRLGAIEHEVFCCLYLDAGHRAIACEDLFRGSLDGADVYPREVAKQALRYNAAALIVAHNHPSGGTEPSKEDWSITSRLRATLHLIDVKLLDHLIVGAGEVVSMRELGFM